MYFRPPLGGFLFERQYRIFRTSHDYSFKNILFCRQRYICFQSDVSKLLYHEYNVRYVDWPGRINI